MSLGVVNRKSAMDELYNCNKFSFGLRYVPLRAWRTVVIAYDEILIAQTTQ